ncbi:ATP-binding protein [Streptomyces sp. CC228A]|uniref:ATP-binding protein n=1 Tax=Streptomyces sp. CC228A TaxID=2898186 RepID=UPI0027E490B3|nr:ATP-binding protein [Streptomyces sp. CC228A]
MPRQPESAQRARQLVGAALHSWGLGNLAEDGVLVVSELVTNAVQHGQYTSLRVRVSRPAPNRVRLAVADRSRKVPIRREPTDEAEAERGLVLVSHVADRWGTDLRRWGKIVWAELSTGKST